MITTLFFKIHFCISSPKVILTLLGDAAIYLLAINVKKLNSVKAIKNTIIKESLTFCLIGIQNPIMINKNVIIIIINNKVVKA